MIWLIGNKGMLGTELSMHFEELAINFVGTDLELDIRDSKALEVFCANKNITWLINCAAYTAVDKAEDEESIVLSINAIAVENLAKLSKKIGARLLHISTDYVFDGTASQPYSENDSVSPIGVYGRSKAEGEYRIKATAPDSIIVRTAWLYGKYGNNFVFNMLRFMKEREFIGVVADQFGSPTWTFDLTNAIIAIVNSSYSTSGIFHFTNEGKVSWYEFACEIYKLGQKYGILKRGCIIKALTTAEYPTKAKRPPNSLLSKDKIKTLGIIIPDWKVSLDKFLSAES